jgi:hypothetical protein
VPQSFLFLSSARKTALTEAGNQGGRAVRNVNFSPVVDGRNYTPEFSTNLTLGGWSPLTTYTGPVINGSHGTITDANAVEPAKFYRINITYP